MTPFRRLLDFISYPSHSRTVGILAVLIIALAIPLTVTVLQKQQEIRQRATGACDPGDPCTGWAYSSCTTTDGQSGHKATCGGNTDPTCYAGPAPNLSSCSTPPPSNLKPLCGTNGGFCTGVQTCRQIEGGTIDKDQRCDTGACCVTGGGGGGGTPIPTPTPSSNTCIPNGGNCVPNPDAGDRIGAPMAGSCPNGQLCYLPFCTNNGGTCYPNPDAAAREGATQIINGSCSLGQCYKTPNAPVCKQPGYTSDICNGNPFGAGGVCDPATSQRVVSLPCTKTCPDGSKVSGTSVSTCQADGCYHNSCSCDATCPSGGGGGGGGTTPTPTPSIAPVNIPNQISCSITPTCPPGYIANIIGATGNWFCLNAKTGAVGEVTPVCGSKGGTILSFTVGLDGIGSTGDQQNSNPNPTSTSQGSNKNPRRSGRPITVEAVNASGTVQKTGNISYDSNSGKYTAVVDFGTLSSGNYTIKIKSDVYLKKNLGIVTLTSGQTNNLNTVNLVTGDVDGDNRLTPLDYSILIGCLFKPATGSCATSDLDDNGIINQFDYNLFIREISKVRDGD